MKTENDNEEMEPSDPGTPRFVKSLRISSPGKPNDLLNKDELPPKDSWIALEPGAELELDAPTKEEWLAEAHRLRKVRGNFLAACFDIEYAVDSVITEVFFPQPVSDVLEIREPKGTSILRIAFQKTFLKGPNNTFGRKVRLLRNVDEQLPKLTTLFGKELFQELDEVVRIRNAFAHYPIVFKPNSKKDESRLFAELAVGKQHVRLTPEFFQKYKTLLPRVNAKLTAIMQSLRQDLSRWEGQSATADGVEGNIGTIFVGDSGLNMTEWMLE